MQNRGITIFLSVLIFHSILTGCIGIETDENDTRSSLEGLPDIEETDSDGGDEPELSEDIQVEIDGCNRPTERGVVLSFDDRKNI